MTLKERIHQIVMDALALNNGNVSKTARELGVDRMTIQRYKKRDRLMRLNENLPG